MKVEVFNGEIGMVQAFGFESSKLWGRIKSGYGPRLRRFAVEFTRKPGITIGYGKDVPHDKSYKLTESVEENLNRLTPSLFTAQERVRAYLRHIPPLPNARSRLSSFIRHLPVDRHCTLLQHRDVASLLDARRRENAQTPQINSFLFALHVAKEPLANRRGWYEAGEIFTRR